MRIVELKTRVHEVPGVETLTMQMLAGRQNDSMNGRLAMTKMSTLELQAVLYSSKDDALATMSAINLSDECGQGDGLLPWRLHSIWGRAIKRC